MTCQKRALTLTEGEAERLLKRLQMEMFLENKEIEVYTVLGSTPILGYDGSRQPAVEVWVRAKAEEGVGMGVGYLVAAYTFLPQPRRK